MLGRLGQFYALLLLFACLATNIAFFAEVREPFLGDEDPMASVKSAFSDLDIQGKIAKLYPKIQSKADEVSDTVPPTPPERRTVSRVEPPLQRTERSAPRESKQHSAPPVETVVADPIVDPFLLLVQPPEVWEEPKPAVSVVVPDVMPDIVPERREPNLQASAIMSAPASVAAVVLPVVAEQFKPITVEPKPVVLVKPSSAPVWDTVDTILDRPIRYD